MDVERGHMVKMCKSVEKGALHGTARPNASTSWKETPWWRKSHHHTGYVGSSQVCSTESNPCESASEEPSVASELFAMTKGSPESAIIVEPKVNGVPLPIELCLHVSHFRKGVERNRARVGTGQVCYLPEDLHR